MSSDGPGRRPEAGWWASVSRHPLWSGLIATVVGGLLVVAILGVFHGITGKAHAGSQISSSSLPGSASASSVITSASPSVRAAPSVTAPSAAVPRQPATYVVPLGVLCNEPGAETPNFNGLYGCEIDNGTAPIGSRVFTWAAVAESSDETAATALSFPQTSCQRIVLDFGFNRELNPDAGSGLRITVSLLQGRSQPSEASVTYDQAGSLKVKLDGSPWDIETTANVPGGEWSAYLNGYARCKSRNGE
jgi:hypothetical protein